MQKSEFLQKAPAYYALEVAVHLREANGKSITEVEIQNIFASDNLLRHKLLFDAAIELLVGSRAIEVEPDDFGPDLILTAGLQSFWIAQSREKGSPFHKFESVRDGHEWLDQALMSVNATYEDFNISSDDFANPDSEWTPLPLDRSDDRLSAAITSLDATIDAVRGDNGYAATVPEERSYVLKTLGDASQLLKDSAVISLTYARRFILEPLGMLIVRFKDAALSVLATAAKEAFIEYIKENAPEWIASLF